VACSEQYVAPDGTIVTEDQVELIDQFRFERKVESARHDETVTELELTPDLDRILREANGDAITGLKIRAVKYDSGSHTVLHN